MNTEFAPTWFNLVLKTKLGAKTTRNAPNGISLMKYQGFTIQLSDSEVSFDELNDVIAYLNRVFYDGFIGGDNDHAVEIIPDSEF